MVTRLHSDDVKLDKILKKLSHHFARTWYGYLTPTDILTLSQHPKIDFKLLDLKGATDRKARGDSQPWTIYCTVDSPIDFKL